MVKWCSIWLLAGDTFSFLESHGVTVSSNHSPRVHKANLKENYGFVVSRTSHYDFELIIGTS